MPGSGFGRCRLGLVERFDFEGDGGALAGGEVEPRGFGRLATRWGIFPT